MSEETAPLVVTLKGGAGYEAPWIVVRGNTPDQLVSMLKNLGELPQTVVEAANLFHGTNNAAPLLGNAPQQAAPQAPPAQQGGWGQQPQQAPQQQGAQLHPDGEQCNACNSVLQYKVVNRKSDGKQFKFWACPNQKRANDGHRSEFAN